MVLVCNHHSVRSIAALVAALSYVVWWVWLYSAITAVYNLYIIVPLLSVYSRMDATITFSLTTTSCPQKVNKSCTSVVCLYNNGCLQWMLLSPFHWLLLLVSHKGNKSCTSFVCLFNNGCCNGCCYHFFIDYFFLSERSISPAPLLSVHSAMDAASTF